MAGETYLAPGAVTVSPRTVGRASWAQKVHESIVIGGKRRYIELGGSDQIGSSSTVYERAVNAPDVELCEEDFRGLTVDMLVWVRVSDPAATVRVRLQNTDDGSPVAEMAAAVSDTTLTRYIAAVTLPAGTLHKWCQLQIQVSDAAHRGYGFGRLRIRA